MSSHINYITICTIMAISYKSQDEGVHNGWKYNISLDWKDDLVISISPSYFIQLPPQGSPNYETISALRNKMININMDNTHRFTKKIRFLGIFSSPVPQTHKGHEFAREYIDSKLGRFNFDQVYRAILDDLKKYT